MITRSDDRSHANGAWRPTVNREMRLVRSDSDVVPLLNTKRKAST